MEQSTKLFLMLGFMFLIFTTLNGHLETYLRVVFGSAKNNGIAGSALGKISEQTGISIPNFGF